MVEHEGIEPYSVPVSNTIFGRGNLTSLTQYYSLAVAVYSDAPLMRQSCPM